MRRKEHLIFRRSSWKNYDLDAISNPSSLPVGLAAAIATGFGIMGAVPGTAQTWYVGVLGKKIDLPEFGGDIGFKLSFSFTAITYPGLRYIEKRYCRR